MDLGTVFFVAFGGFVVILIAVPIFRWVSTLNQMDRVQTSYRTTRIASEVGEGQYEAWIYPDGRELFLPPPNSANPVYEIEFSRTIAKDVAVFEDPGSADALYRTDENGNFTRDHPWLHISGKEFTYGRGGLIEADRASHVYRIRVDGGRERLTLALQPPTWFRCSQGALFVRIAVLPDNTQTHEAKRRETETQIAAASLRLEQQRNNSAEAKRFSEQIAALTVRAQVLRNWGDPEFQRRFAEMNRDQLLHRQDEIRSATIKLLDQHQLVQYLKRHNPEVMRRLLGEFEALVIAEDLQTKKALPPPPRRHLSIEDFRKKLCERIEVAGEDRKALLATVLQQKQRMIVKLDEFDLSDDEREDYMKEIEDWAAGERVRAEDGRGENGNSKTI
jgi:hypothetical protein